MECLVFMLVYRSMSRAVYMLLKSLIKRSMLNIITGLLVYFIAPIVTDDTDIPVLENDNLNELTNVTLNAIVFVIVPVPFIFVQGTAGDPAK